ncbi:MAG: FAD-binding oxidoreductase [Acidaminococcales bacterium]|nr:FAD-binding oxidoreductase [Acidaminococcales bacterium]
MPEYNAVDRTILAQLREIAGFEHVIDDPEKLEAYKTDEETNPRYHRLPEAAVFPGNVGEVAAIIKLANRRRFPVTPRCGGTSLCGGAIAAHGGIVMVMSRMNKIKEINERSLYMAVECGVRTEDIQKAANAKGLLYAGDPCSADSCLIGGNLATNAGGNKAVRYGTTRHQVYSIEVVTPTGDIVNLGARLNKKTTGYCLEQLVIGSEGTLGVITGAVLKLVPLPPCRIDLLAVFTDVDKAIDIVPQIIKAGINPTSIEFMANNAIQSAGRYCDLRLPRFADGSYVIVTVETFSEDELEQKAALLDGLCSKGGAAEVLEADERVWRLRKAYSEAARSESKVNSHEDIVVPVDSIATMLKKMNEIEKKYNLQVRTVAHAGDGNIHFIPLKMDMDDREWEETLDKFHGEVYEYVYSLGGRLSGEHGIGCKKIDTMELFTDPVEMRMMKTIKRALDPNGILNPGKIFAPD